jgi:hypothetical protein
VPAESAAIEVMRQSLDQHAARAATASTEFDLLEAGVEHHGLWYGALTEQITTVAGCGYRSAP